MGNTRDVAGGAVETVAHIKWDYCTCALGNKTYVRCLTSKSAFWHVVIFYAKNGSRRSAFS